MDVFITLTLTFKKIIILFCMLLYVIYVSVNMIGTCIFVKKILQYILREKQCFDTGSKGSLSV